MFVTPDVRAQIRPSSSHLDSKSLLDQGLRLADTLVRLLERSMGRILPHDDMVSLGHLGLVDALRRFDGTLKVEFRTYASHRIRGAILDGMRKEDSIPRGGFALSLNLADGCAEESGANDIIANVQDACFLSSRPSRKARSAPLTSTSPPPSPGFWAQPRRCCHSATTSLGKRPASASRPSNDCQTTLLRYRRPTCATSQSGLPPTSFAPWPKTAT